MDALSFVAGLATGLKNGGGSEEITDPDLAIWESLPEPADNGSVFLVRITDITQQVQITVDYVSTEVEYSVAVDWGDGSQTVIENETSFNHPKHVYSNAGDYVITVTSSDLENFRAWFAYCYYADYSNQYANYWLMAKYGENVLLEKAYSNGFGNFSVKEKLKYLKISSQTVLAAGFFDGCRALRQIDYDKAVEIIPVNTFRNCSALRFFNWDVTQLKTIESNAFQNCMALQSVTLPLCTSIGDSAFTDCYNLQKVSTPSCTAVGKSGFAHNYSLLFAQFAEGCTFGSGAFLSCYSLNHILA